MAGVARASVQITVRPVAEGDHASWLRMRCALWPEGSAEEHSTEIEQFFAGLSREPLAVLIAETSLSAVGFAELSIRPTAEGCTSQNVGYVEGWFVVPEARGQGVGRALIEASESWARARGCLELASDTESENETSVHAHLAVGFTEVGQIRCFRKDL